MTFVYYSALEATIYFLDHKVDDHGQLLGSISSLPMRPAFVVQSLLTNAGFHDITGLAFAYGERQPPPTEETPPHVSSPNILPYDRVHHDLQLISPQAGELV